MEALASPPRKRIHRCGQAAVTLRKKTSNRPPGGRIGWVVAMGFDDDDDWALSDDGWNLILAGGDHVVDDFADDLEALRSGRRGFKDTSMFRALPPLHLGQYDEAFAEAFRRRPGPWRRSCVGRTRRAGPTRRKDCSARLPTSSPWRRSWWERRSRPSCAWTPAF